MDRRILVGLMLTAVLGLGCSNSSSKDAGASAKPEAAAESQKVSETHRPVIVSEMTVTEGPGDDWRGKGVSPPAGTPTAPETTFRHKTEYDFPTDTVEGALEKPRSVDLAANPLRGQADQAPLSPAPSPNPLRIGFAPQAVPAPQFMPVPDFVPSGGAAPPAPSPPSAFAPEGFSIDSSASGAAPNEAAHGLAEAERVAREYEERARAEAAARAAMLAEQKREEESARASMKAAMPAPPAEANEYDVVHVFYGTDRQSSATTVSVWAGAIEWFLPTGFSVLVTLCLVLAAASRRNLTLGLCSFLVAAVSLGLGYQAAMKTLTAVRQVGKEGLQYTTSRALDGKVDVGFCEVTIPKTHVVGELEAPSVVRLEVREDAARHIVLRKAERLEDEPFYMQLRQRVEASQRKELFVFVHGFNVSFEEAARRTAQIHYDLRFEGAPMFFSWPAHDKFLLTYPADENNVEWSAPHLKQFLLNVARNSGAKSINLIAHSMGNRALAAALREIELEMRDQSRLFNQVILAAPDIDAHDFRTNIAPAMRRTAQRMTLYASSRDDALLASQLLHRGPRAGDAGEGLVVIQGIDTIDVTAIDSSPWGHLYYGSSDPVLQDLKLLFSLATAPPGRRWLTPAEREGLTYWIFQPTRTATGDGPVTR